MHLNFDLTMLAYSGFTLAIFLFGFGMVLAPSIHSRAVFGDLSFAGRFKRLFASPKTFLFTTGLFLLVGRIPGTLSPNALNLDEAQILSAARALAADPVFFRSAECGTVGPLSVYFVALPALVGIEATYFTARLTGLVMIWFCCATIYWSCRRALPESAARLGAFIPATFFALTHYGDFIHYTSEHAPLFFLFCGILPLALIAFPAGRFDDCPRSASRLYVISMGCLSAIAFSAVPFAKLQAAYLAMFFGLTLLGVVYLRTIGSWKTRLVDCVAVGASALALPLIAMLVMTSFDVWDYFLNAYVANAFLYVESGYTHVCRSGLLGQMILRIGDILSLLLGVGVAIIFLAPAHLSPAVGRFRSKSQIALLAISAFALHLAFVTVLAPRRDFDHYLVFLPPFLGIFIATLLGTLIDRKAGSTRWFGFASSLVIGFATLMPVVVYYAEHPNPFVKQLDEWKRIRDEPQTPVARMLRIQAETGNGFLAVWGYAPNLYLDAGMLQATRLSTTPWVGNPEPLRSVYREAFLTDMERNQPAFFVDAVTPDAFFWMNDPETQSYESDAKVREYIDTHYREIRNIQGVRVFRRK